MMSSSKNQPLSTQRTQRHREHGENLFMNAFLRALCVSVISVFEEVSK
jgi:hypothetical protein